VLPLAEVVLTAWFFLSPVLYPLDLVAGRLSAPLLGLYGANPLVGSLALMQSAFLGQPLPLGPVAASLGLTAAGLAGAAWLFGRRMRGVAELL
jgi:ABC-type polysaccharide/polyol phosphate export permease